MTIFVTFDALINLLIENKRVNAESGISFYNDTSMLQ